MNAIPWPKDSEGLTPHTIALRYGHKQCAELIGEIWHLLLDNISVFFHLQYTVWHEKHMSGMSKWHSTFFDKHFLHKF